MQVDLDHDWSLADAAALSGYERYFDTMRADRDAVAKPQFRRNASIDGPVLLLSATRDEFCGGRFRFGDGPLKGSGVTLGGTVLSVLVPTWESPFRPSWLAFAWPASSTPLRARSPHRRQP
jgi:hypothetical protein